jgi:hypothetical protein
LRVIAICVIIELKIEMMKVIYFPLIIFEEVIRRCVKKGLKMIKNFRVIFDLIDNRNFCLKINI